MVRRAVRGNAIARYGADRGSELLGEKFRGAAEGVEARLFVCAFDWRSSVFAIALDGMNGHARRVEAVVGAGIDLTG